MILATFQNDGSFKVTGRGLVIYGDIMSGIVHKENYISFNNQTQQIKLKIKSVGMIDYIQTNLAKVCFSFYYENDAEREILEALKVKKQIVTVTEE